MDLACGRCNEASVLSAFFGGNNFGFASNKVKVIGVDTDKQEIERARVNYNISQVDELRENFEFINGDATELDRYPLIPEQVDVVVIRHQQISEDVEKWTKILQQALERVRLEGIVVATSYSDDEHGMLLKTLEKLPCQVVVNQRNPYSRRLGHNQISVDRNIVIIRK